ncbi:U6 snRNA-associated Sm-like protein LSm4 isoform X2 [Lepidochelys kempii]|uniref:U6 snRNA-associated Sm-like protein LSm4 isoform X2 n=1 Tax=Lepidochelys kempii TaxID=8472 RepID=UPI003C6FFDF6
MLPLSLLKTAQNHPMLVELKNGETYNGHLVSCDNWMNINLREVICTSRDGDKFWRMPECYIRGSTIKYLRIPDEIIDMVKEEVVSKGRGRGGMQQQKQQKGRGGGGAGRVDARRRTGSHLLVLLVAGDVFDVDVPGPLDGVGDHEAPHEPCVASTDPTGPQHTLVAGVPSAQGSDSQDIHLHLVALLSQGVSQGLSSLRAQALRKAGVLFSKETVTSTRMIFFWASSVTDALAVPAVWQEQPLVLKHSCVYLWGKCLH